MNYKPTMALRFVEREEESIFTADGALLQPGTVRVIKRRVLQQHWMNDYGHGEWRDVQMADEVPNAQGNGLASTGPTKD